jgi:Flp pilus assembly protein TadG
MRMRKRTGRRPASRHNRRGAVMIEMALVLPLFLMVMLGTIEFGRAIMVTHMLANATRDGARLAILDQMDESTITTLVESSAQSMIGPGTYSATVTVTPRGDSSASGLSSAERGDEVRVRVTVPLRSVSFFMLYMRDMDLAGSCVMRHEGPKN